MAGVGETLAISWASGPAVGKRYVLKRSRDPWGLKPTVMCIVIDVRDGWVRYRFEGAGTDNVLEADSFINAYSVVENS